LSNDVDASAAEHDLSTHLSAVGFQRQSEPLVFVLHAPSIKYEEQLTFSVHPPTLKTQLVETA
jgi:hypothetical protein